MYAQRNEKRERSFFFLSVLHQWVDRERERELGGVATSMPFSRNWQKKNRKKRKEKKKRRPSKRKSRNFNSLDTLHSTIESSRAHTMTNVSFSSSSADIRSLLRIRITPTNQQIVVRITQRYRDPLVFAQICHCDRSLTCRWLRHWLLNYSNSRTRWADRRQMNDYPSAACPRMARSQRRNNLLDCSMWV